MRDPLASPFELGAMVALQGLALALAAIAWNGASTEATPTGQMSWIGIALVAAVVSGGVNAAWLLRARRAVGLRQRAVAARVRELDGVAAGTSWAAGTESSDMTVAVPGLALYHRDGCALVEGRPRVRGGHRSDQEAAGLRPCGWCQPEPTSAVSPS